MVAMYSTTSFVLETSPETSTTNSSEQSTSRPAS